MNGRTVKALLAFGIAFVLASPLDAEVVRITISSRAPVFNGQSFGAVGPYEDIRGVAFGELDPRDPRNAVITDIELAPRNARGMVEYRTTFTLRKPVDMTRSAGVLLYDIVNRGNHTAPNTWHVGGDPGDGFLYRLGHAVLWSGWQGDLPIASVGAVREGIDVPVAKRADGAAVTGRVWARFVSVAGRGQHEPLPGAAGRMPATLDTASATLVSVASETPAGVKSGVVAIAASDWAFADCRTVPFPGTPDPTRICLKSEFDPELLYELVYTAKDPYVLGVGMAAMRDVVSFFRYARGGLGRDGQSDRRRRAARRRDGQLAVGPFREGVPQSWLQPGRARPHRVGRPQRADRRHARQLQHALRAAGRHRRAVRPGRRGATLVGRLRRSRARPARVGLAPPLHRDEDLSEDH